MKRYQVKVTGCPIWGREGVLVDVQDVDASSPQAAAQRAVQGFQKARKLRDQVGRKWLVEVLRTG